MRAVWILIEQWSVCLLPLPTNIKRELLQPLNVHLHQLISRRLLGLLPQTGAASCVLLVLSPPASWAEQLLVFFGFMVCRWPFWNSDSVSQVNRYPIIIIYTFIGSVPLENLTNMDLGTESHSRKTELEE